MPRRLHASDAIHPAGDRLAASVGRRRRHLSLGEGPLVLGEIGRLRLWKALAARLMVFVWR